MKRSILIFSLFAFTGGLADTAEAMKYRNRDKYRPHSSHSKTTLDLNTGIRLDQLDWNIASDITGTSTPNILSELTWSDIMLWEIKGHVRHTVPASFSILRGSLMFEGEFTGGLTLSGDNQDSDYFGNDRTSEFSRSNNDAGTGFAFGGEVAAGYQFNIAQKVRPGSETYFTLTPLAGYSWDRQKYKMKDGHQTIPAFGDFAGLDSSYRADWFGPFYGIEAALEHNRHLFTVRGEQHTFDYEGQGIWNLRDDFEQDPSFEHTADGDGIEIGLGYSYSMDSVYDFTLEYDYVRRKAEDGVDRTFFSDGTEATTRLNEVNNDSHALRAGFKYYFRPPQKSAVTHKQTN